MTSDPHSFTAMAVGLVAFACIVIVMRTLVPLFQQPGHDTVAFRITTGAAVLPRRTVGPYHMAFLIGSSDDPGVAAIATLFWRGALGVRGDRLIVVDRTVPDEAIERDALESAEGQRPRALARVLTRRNRSRYIAETEGLGLRVSSVQRAAAVLSCVSTSTLICAVAIAGWQVSAETGIVLTAFALTAIPYTLGPWAFALCRASNACDQIGGHLCRESDKAVTPSDGPTVASLRVQVATQGFFAAAWHSELAGLRPAFGRPTMDDHPQATGVDGPAWRAHIEPPTAAVLRRAYWTSALACVVSSAFFAGVLWSGWTVTRFLAAGL